MADFFEDTKIIMIPSLNLYKFGGRIKCMEVVISFAKYIDFCINPLCTGGLNAVRVLLFKSSLNIIVNSLVEFNGFK